jgi:CheY-like chemotaxis protein
MKKILIADDEPLIRKMVGLVCNRAGYDTAYAENGELAYVSWLSSREKREHYDLILTDVLMPTWSGTRLYHAVRSKEHEVAEIKPSIKHIPFLFMSGHLGNHGKEMERILEDDPHTAFLPKPFRVNEIPETIAQILQKSYKSHSFLNS